MSKSVLVVGGTGPTGPHILQGLLDRGYDVTIFHRGTHEPPELPDVRHVHGDPHFRETIDEAVGTEDFDVVLAAYGRINLLADSFVGRTDHFLAIGGPPRYAGFNAPTLMSPSGLSLPVREDAPLATVLDGEGHPSVQFGQKIVRSESRVFESHPLATYLIYPVVYGPRNLWPWEWSVLKRVQDGRGTLLIPDEGLAVHARGAARNLAEFVLLAIDQPAVAQGQVYNCADDTQYSVRQWVELILERVGASLEIVSIPSEIAPPIKAIYVPTSISIADHTLLDTGKARSELGYRDVVTPRQAIDELVDWYRDNPEPEMAGFPAFIDAFDYELEDRLVDAWRGVAAELAALVTVEVPAEFHPMPHPKAPNQLLDQKAR